MDYIYKIENESKYRITAKKIKTNIELRIYDNCNDKDNYYISLYRLEFLNNKLGKKCSFKSISNFINCLENNINNGCLKIESVYGSMIRTVWKIFPNKKSNQETFTLLSKRNYNRKLSIFFYSNFKGAEKAFIEILRQENTNNSSETNVLESNLNTSENKIDNSDTLKSSVFNFFHSKTNIHITSLPNNIVNNYYQKKLIERENHLEYNYNNGFLIDNFNFLKDNDENKKEAFHKMIDEYSKSSKKNYRNVLVFFEEENL